MKKNILGLMLICSVAVAAGPKFHFKDCVQVISGFYKGCNGTVEYYDGDQRYEVYLDCKNEVFSSLFEEKELMRSKACQK